MVVLVREIERLCCGREVERKDDLHVDVLAVEYRKDLGCLEGL
jgi:hypothetical protein